MAKAIKTRAQSQGLTKLVSSFNALVRTQSFKNEVISLRKKYHIPLEGFLLKEAINSPVSMEGSLMEPKEWVYAGKPEYRHKIREDAEKILNPRGFFGLHWHLCFKAYLLYDLNFANNEPVIESSLCKVTDVEEDETMRHYIEVEGRFNEFPVAIQISPYATTRDIIDFIRKNKNQIQYIQSRFQNPISNIKKIRTKNPLKQARNDFIYKNRNLRHKQIIALLPKELNFGVDEGSIGKIISIERKRRN